MRKITLNKIITERTQQVDRFNDTEEPGEGAAEQTPVVVTKPVIINVDTIRCFNARKDDKPGARITFIDGGGFAVTDTVDEVNALTDEPGSSTATPVVDPAARTRASRNGARAH